jgi:hypothetical protein
MSNELVTLPNGDEIVNFSIDAANLATMPTSTNITAFEPTVNVAAKYIKVEEWMKGGTINPIPFYGYVLGFINAEKVDTKTGELKTVRNVQLLGGFDENGSITNAFYVAGQAVLVSAIEQAIAIGLGKSLFKIACIGTKTNAHNGQTYLFSVIPMIQKIV